MHAAAARRKVTGDARRRHEAMRQPAGEREANGRRGASGQDKRQRGLNCDNKPMNERQMEGEAPVDKRRGGLNCDTQPANERQTGGERRGASGQEAMGPQ